MRALLALGLALLLTLTAERAVAAPMLLRAADIVTIALLFVYACAACDHGVRDARGAR